MPFLHITNPFELQIIGRISQHTKHVTPATSFDGGGGGGSHPGPSGLHTHRDAPHRRGASYPRTPWSTDRTIEPGRAFRSSLMQLFVNTWTLLETCARETLGET